MPTSGYRMPRRAHVPAQTRVLTDTGIPINADARHPHNPPHMSQKKFSDPPNQRTYDCRQTKDQTRF